MKKKKISFDYYPVIVFGALAATVQEVSPSVVRPTCFSLHFCNTPPTFALLLPSSCHRELKIQTTLRGNNEAKKPLVGLGYELR